MDKYIIVLGNSRNKNIEAILVSLCDAFDLPKEIDYACDNTILQRFILQTNVQNLLKIHALSPRDCATDENGILNSQCEEFSSPGTTITEPPTSEFANTRLLFIPAEQNLAQQMHQLYRWHQQYRFEIQMIISVMDSAFFASNCPNLRDAMAHFADLLFIDNIPANKIPPITNEQLKAYVNHCKKKECYPLPIKILTSPDVTHIRELNDSRSRRMTLIFDDIDPIELLDESKIGQAPFTIPALNQCDKYLRQDEQERYVTPIESLI